MSATTALTEVDPASWDALIARLGCDDAYLRRGYLESAALLEPGTPTFLHLSAPGGDVVFAFLLRDDPVDVISPYGYGGPVAVGDDPPVREFWRAYEEWCAARGAISSFIRFHPLYANHRAVGPQVALEPLGNTIAWALQEPADLYEAMHSDHRRLVRKAREAGLSVEIREQPGDLDGFVALYEATMERKGAGGFYFFGPEYWRAMLALEGLIVAEARQDETVVSSALFLASQPRLHYHLSASNEAGLTFGGSRLMLLESARWARERGFEVLHLGGGVGGESQSLFRFKQRFYPPGEVECWIGKAVHDRATYLDLAGMSELSLEGFFPAYRESGR